MPDNPPPPSPAQNDGIYTIHVNLPSCYLKPAGSIEPQLPDGTFSFDAQEDHWKPSRNDPKRQEFRIQCKNEIVFIAGAQYTYRPNTSLYIKCKKATFIPHPTDSSQKTVMVRMPGADAEQNLPAKGGDGKSGTTASVQLGPLPEGSKLPIALGSWENVLEVTNGATEGGAGADGATGSQGADAGSLTMEADSYDTSALTEDTLFFITDCTGGRGQQGGDGGDGGGGGKGVDTAGERWDSLGHTITLTLKFQGPWIVWPWKIKSSPQYQELIDKGFLGAKGGPAGQQGIGGYGGSGGRFTVNLPKDSAGDDRLKARFGVYSSVGTPGTTGTAGKPGPGGRCGDMWLFKYPTWFTSNHSLMDWLTFKFLFDFSSDAGKKWVEYIVSGTEPSPVNGDAAKPLGGQDVQDRRVRARQHTPTTSPKVVFKEVNKQ